MTPPNDKPLPYNLSVWSDGYYSVSDDGELLLCAGRDESSGISVSELVRSVEEMGLRLPVLIRSKDILHDRVNCLVDEFNQACEALKYSGEYKVVYPIKVNQQRRVVEELIRSEPARSKGQVGLEAGSKPELLAVLAMSLDTGSAIVCNGYKDREYIRMALMGQALGYQVYIVVEKLSELKMILEESELLNITPLIGMRARLSSIGKGNWQNTGGEKSKFGLSSGQMIEAVDLLKEAGRLDQLKLLHFHLGSQIANIRDIQGGLLECARIFSQLAHMGASIDTVDIGGGLGVDYDGTRSRNLCSINYQLSDYAHSVVSAFKDECEATGLDHPNIISESGRALTAHHAILVTDVVASECNFSRAQKVDLGLKQKGAVGHLQDDYDSLQSGKSRRSLIEIYHDAEQAIGEVQLQFVQGSLDIIQKNHAEQLYLAICDCLRSQLDPNHRDHLEILDELNQKLAEKLFVNFSVFQSLPDVWGIDQVFPVTPLVGLNKPMVRHVVIQDITCDSDGRMDQYVSEKGIESTLRLPESSSERELLCFFMIGAYQEILGDMHNLFGDTDSIDVGLDEAGNICLEHEIRGDTIANVLETVNLDTQYLMGNYRRLLNKQNYSDEEQDKFLRAFEQGLGSYTYLNT